MQNSILFIPLLSGTILFIVGLILMKYPPKKINSIYGYKTPSSMKSQERWDFAQKYASRELMNMGFFLSVTSLIGKLIQLDEQSTVWVGLAMTIFTVVLVIVKVEKAIKEKFGKD